ncbi:MAG: hypothetical protein AAFY82_03375 [Pseudomonadota bacterium]
MLRTIAIAVSVYGILALPAFANGLKAVQTVEKATISLDADGQEIRTYVPAEEVAPGDEVRYRLTYVNDGALAAEAVSLTMPVPGEVTYVEASADGPANLVTYSADGGLNYAARDELIMASAEGARLATAEEITHIQWTFETPIPAASMGEVSFRGVLK